MTRALLPLALLLGCTAPDDDPAETGDTSSGVQPRDYSDCDPLSYDYCSLPYPSSFYERADETSPTGVRVHLGETTLPANQFGQQPAPTSWNQLDGFSPMGPLLVYFPDLALTGVNGHDDIGASLDGAAKIHVIDAESGERMPIWSELDVSGFVQPGSEFLLIRPAVPLLNGHRYIVGIRGLVDSTGATIPASEGFAALRDGTATDNWDIEGRRELYEGIFASLEQDGMARGDLQLAWDFTVGSTEGITGRATHIIADAVATVGAAGPSYVIDEIDDDYNDHIWRRVLGRMTVPLYTEEDAPGTMLTRGDDGMPYQNGTTTVPFTILIPRTAQTDPRPLPLVQYGHGLLGAQDEVQGGYLREMADADGFILFAVDWTGMKDEDTDAITVMITTDLGSFGIIPERMHQGYVEFVMAAAMMQGAMAQDEAMMLPDPESGELVPVVDAETLYYYGNSQGGIYGGTYMALSPTIERGVLGVPGMPYSLLLSRSADFTAFFGLFQAMYPDQRDISMWMALMQNLWDSAEPGGYGRQVTEEPLWGFPKQILIQDAIGDAQVTTLGAQNMARAYGAVLIDPPLQEVWGLETKASGWKGSAIAEYDYGVPPVPFDNTPPDPDYDTHEDTRRNPAAQRQLWTFLTTGTVVQYCDGICDPE